MGKFTKDGVAEIEVAETGEINLSEIVDDPDVRYVLCMSGEEFRKFLTEGDHELRIEKASFLERKYAFDVFWLNKKKVFQNQELFKGFLFDDEMSLESLEKKWEEIDTSIFD